MNIVARISILNDPRISAYRSLKGNELARDGLFIAEGLKVVETLLKADIKILSCLTTPEFVKKPGASLPELKRRKVPVYILPREEIRKIIGFQFHNGIMACCRMPKKVAVEDGLKSLARPSAIIAMNGVNDPENVGMIVRNAVAFGVRAVIVDQKTYDPYYRRAVRVSMGAVFNIPVYYTCDLSASLKWMKANLGTRVIATCLGRKSKDIAAVNMSGNICIVLGNEDKGVDKDVLETSDIACKIPIAASIDSINVACASAIIMNQVNGVRT